MAKLPVPKKGDVSLVNSVKLRKKSLERDAVRLRKEINALTESLYEIQSKIGIMDQLIASESPKKKSTAKVLSSDSNIEVANRRIPAAIKKNI